RADNSGVSEVATEKTLSTEQSAGIDERLRASDGPVDDQAPTIYQRESSVGVFAGEGLRSRTHLGQAKKPADHPGKVRAGVVIACDQIGCPQRDPATTSQRADGLTKIIQVKGSSGCHHECGLRGEGVNRPGRQGPAVYRGRSGISVHPRKNQRSGISFSE